jgi:dienelactone hydrolase
MQGSCCPKGSWPRLQANYESKGERLEINGTICYHIGEGNKVLVLVSDIFGAKSGKHEAFADTFSTLGYNVYLPEILDTPYNGEMDKGKIIANIKSQN